MTRAVYLDVLVLLNNYVGKAKIKGKVEVMHHFPASKKTKTEMTIFKTELRMKEYIL